MLAGSRVAVGVLLAGLASTRLLGRAGATKAVAVVTPWCGRDARTPPGQLTPKSSTPAHSAPEASTSSIGTVTAPNRWNSPAAGLSASGS